MRLRLILILSALPIAAAAHHSFAVFDLSRKVTLAGTVKDFQWTNPHMWIQLVVAKDGKPVEYSIEAQSPNILARRGWSQDSLKPGDKVALLINPLKTDQPGGSLLGVRLPDGSALGEAP